MEKIDLHIHSNLSDGNCDVNEIIKISKNNNCNKISITDHEIINDYSTIGNKNALTIINGIEFNTFERGMHILGYGILDLEKVNNVMDSLHRENEYISFELIEKLKKLNINISKEKIDEYLNSVGIKYKYLDKRHIVKYLIYKGYTKNVPDAYNNLIGKGTELYIPLKKIKSNDIIELINDSGGVPVLAHPSTLLLKEKDLLIKLKELQNYGLEGVEIINNKISKEQEILYVSLANKLKLIKTVGSDFHTIEDNNIGISCNEEIFEKLDEKIKIKKK